MIRVTPQIQLLRQNTATSTEPCAPSDLHFWYARRFVIATEQEQAQMRLKLDWTALFPPLGQSMPPLTRVAPNTGMDAAVCERIHRVVADKQVTPSLTGRDSWLLLIVRSETEHWRSSAAYRHCLCQLSA